MYLKRDSHYYRLAINTILFALGNIGSKFIVFILMPLYTTKLTTSEYGISELVLTGTNLLIPFVSVSIQDATLRFAVSKENKSGEVLKNTILVLSFSSVIIILLKPVISIYAPIAPWSEYFVLISILYMIRNALSVYVKAINKTKLYAVDSILYTVLLMTTNIVFLVKLNAGLKGYFVAIIISTFSSIVFLCCAGRLIKNCLDSKINMALLKQMVFFSFPMIINNISWWIINSSDRIMIEHFESVEASGIYSVAAKIPSLLTTITSIFNQAWLLSSIAEYEEGRNSGFFSNIFALFDALIICTSSLIIIFIKPFMQVYVGHDFVESWKYVPFLLLGSAFQSYSTFFGAIYTSAKKNTSVMLTTLIAAISNIVFNLILIPILGVQGAVLATAFSYFIIFILRMFESQKYIRFNINFFAIFVSILILIIQCIITIANVPKVIIFSSICFLSLLALKILYIKELLKKIVFKFHLRK